MKKLMYTLFLVLGVVSFSFAQEASEIATSNGSRALAQSKASGTYVFTLPSQMTEEKVKKNASYYTHYFTVSYNKQSHEATIEMASDNAKNRFIIARFLTACGARYVAVDDANLNMAEFIEDHLK